MAVFFVFSRNTCPISPHSAFSHKQTYMHLTLDVFYGFTDIHTKNRA